MRTANGRQNGKGGRPWTAEEGRRRPKVDNLAGGGRGSKGMMSKYLVGRREENEGMRACICNSLL